jgi:hypothetical protein
MPHIEAKHGPQILPEGIEDPALVFFYFSRSQQNTYVKIGLESGMDLNPETMDN